MEEIRCEMKPYSQDLRERVVKAVDEGHSRREIVNLFGVSEATIKRYLKQRRETGNMAPKPIPGYPPRKLGALPKGLQPQLEAHPDATLEEHCRLWEAQTGVKVSISTMSDAIQRLKWTRKKRRWRQVREMKKNAENGERKQKILMSRNVDFSMN